MEVIIVKNPIKKSEVGDLAKKGFGDMVKVVVDIGQGILALGGELHADEEVLLMERENSARENTWGINIYPEKSDEDWIEFDSMINLKPVSGNRSRDVKDPIIKEKIIETVKRLIID